MKVIKPGATTPASSHNGAQGAQATAGSRSRPGRPRYFYGGDQVCRCEATGVAPIGPDPDVEAAANNAASTRTRLYYDAEQRIIRPAGAGPTLTRPIAEPIIRKDSDFLPP